MWEQIVNLAISNGLFAVLFLGLLVYQLKDSRTREQKYQMTIEKLGNSLEIVKQVKEDVEDIKDKINQKKIVFRKVKEKTNEEKA
ncbi:MAG TPA: hypothetical protein DD614_04195 [Clostridiales bacterium]|nr:hypothetical protein [Clostridiales bacterium]